MKLLLTNWRAISTRQKQDPEAEIIAGGHYDKSVGYFIEPTVIQTKNPRYITMCEELFGPILTVYVYDDDKYEETLEILDKTSPYALDRDQFLPDDRYIIDYDNQAPGQCCRQFLYQ